MESLTIYILCHDRTDYARQAISSVLRQTDRKFALLVSDNSSNDEVGRMVKSEYPEIRYIRRSPMLPALEHFNRCIDEAASDYFCLFHDDDLMDPDYVAAMQHCIRDCPEAILIGCNARMEQSGKLEPRNCFRALRKHELIESPRNLAQRYFSRAQSGFAPFPGYIYNRRLVGDCRIPVAGGKYADVTWLLNLARKGPVVWLNRPLMTYRLHESNDGGIESPRDRLRFLAYLKANRAEFGEGIIKDYRCSFIYKKIMKTSGDQASTRYRTAVSFLRYYRLNRYLRPDYYKALAVRVLIKWVAEK